jgi:hypothetical protein
MGDRRVACRMFLGRREEKRLLRRPRFRWEENIKMDLQEVGWACMDCIDQFQDRYRWQVLVNMVARLWVS